MPLPSVTVVMVVIDLTGSARRAAAQWAVAIRLLRWAHATSIKVDGGVHFDPAACPKHPPLSFGASTPPQANT